MAEELNLGKQHSSEMGSGLIEHALLLVLVLVVAVTSVATVGVQTSTNLSWLGGELDARPGGGQFPIIIVPKGFTPVLKPSCPAGTTPLPPAMQVKLGRYCW
jgi:Flp pilus assembly pilin Flp